MAKRIVLVRNPGNSGGAWLSKVFSSHKDILMFPEITHGLTISYDPRHVHPQVDINFKRRIGQNVKGYNFEVSTQYDIARGFLIDQFAKREEEVIGLIKVFDKTTIDKCKEICSSVKVIQTYRNPIGIIDFYTGYKMKLNLFAEKESFENTTAQFYRSFSTLVKNNELHIRLEDLNSSLINKTLFFKETIEKIFEVKCSDEFVEEFSEDHGDDGSISKEIFKKWAPWKKEYFLKYFESIMKQLNYTYIME